MTSHTATCLKGPVTLERPWWAPRKRKSARRRQAASSGIRADLVARVRRELADGTYDTPEKWEKALSRLFRHVAAK
jgi:hypothetical protein